VAEPGALVRGYSGGGATNERGRGAGFIKSLATGPSYGPLRGLLLLLTVLTGVADAVSILSLSRVLVANMTGNMVLTMTLTRVAASWRAFPRPAAG
jgi:F0F1-type ATP synthase membrane subunit a